jgi:hypothetical protein
MLTQERLKELLDYDPETGVFTRKVRTTSKIHVGDAAGGLDSKGYLLIRVDGKRYIAHRLAWLYIHGCWPDKDLDHINRIKTDNRIGNLREVTKAQNQWNTSSYKNNTSGYPGVSWHRKDKKWRARISIHGKYMFLGNYATPEAAYVAYMEAKEQIHRIGEGQ